jgi:hypothetical protein
MIVSFDSTLFVGSQAASQLPSLPSGSFMRLDLYMTSIGRTLSHSSSTSSSTSL